MYYNFSSIPSSIPSPYTIHFKEIIATYTLLLLSCLSSSWNVALGHHVRRLIWPRAASEVLGGEPRHPGQQPAPMARHVARVRPSQTFSPANPPAESKHVTEPGEISRGTSQPIHGIMKINKSRLF